MRQHSVFEIQLADKEVVFYGSSAECSGKVLQGTLLVHPTDALKVKSLTLQFTGRVQTQWTSGAGALQRVCSEQVTLIEKRWTFLQPQKKPHHLPPGTHLYDFEVTLPGDLPASVVVDYGLVEYKFKAILERPTFSLNYTDRQLLTIRRALLPSAPALNELIYLSDTWDEQLNYEVYSPNKAFGMGEDMPLNFKLLSLDEGLRVQSVTCLLKEYVTVSAHSEDGSILTKCDGRVQSRASRTITQHAPSLELTLNVPIPPLTREGAHCFMESDLIRIDHKVKILIVLSDHHDRLHRILAKVGVVIMPTPRVEALNALPRYQSYTEPIPRIGLLRASETPATNPNDPNLPSYKSQWCPLPSTPSLSSLPSYGPRLLNSELAR
ncbi:hypothetical protein DSO57_1020789 [Entomophthora muscae]|uniref:Uncharacterized protein n=1 Tax=Entomophthora muscae TaxID=34485 RepID=A0ACC2SGN6_9FUNG|nr:hypothetical protein DSO57_1020789 [Entomophthora muscae]